MITPQINRKSDFRITHFIAFLCLFVAGSTFAVAKTTRQQVYDFAANQAKKDINQIAKQNNWQGHSAKLDIFIPGEVNSYANCVKSLKISTSTATGNSTDLTRLRYGIRCDNKKSWEIVVTVKPNVHLPIFLVKNSVERGNEITADDIELKRYNISNARQGFMTNRNEIIGLTTKRRLRAGQPIIPSQLEQPILVKRGQQVIIIASQDDIEVRAIGEAITDGHKGQIIKIRNLSSKTVISATVEDEGVVRVSNL